MHSHRIATALILLLLAPPNSRGQYSDCDVVWGPIVEMSAGVPDFIGDHYHPLIAAIGDTIHYCWEPAVYAGESFFRMPYKRSTDDGVSWEETRELILDSIRVPFSPGHSTIHSTDGKVAIYFSKSLANDTDYAYMLQTTDNGTNWSPLIQATASHASILYTGAHRYDTSATVHVPELHLGTRVLSSSLDGGSTWYDGPMVMPQDDFLSTAMSPGVINVLHSPYAEEGPREVFLERTSDQGDSWFETTPLSSHDWNSSDIVSLSTYIDEECATPTILGTDWRDAKYGGLMFSASAIARLSLDDGGTWGEEYVLTEEPRSFLCMIKANRNYVAATWTQEVVENDTFRIQARYSTDRGREWSPICDVTPDSWWATYATIAVTRTAIHVAWEEVVDTCCKSRVFYRRGAFQHPDGQMSLSSNTFSFDTTLAGVSVFDSVLVSNPGTDSLSISLAISDIPDFKVIPAMLKVAPGTNRWWHVAFQPFNEGNLTGKITLFSNSPTSPDCIALRGTSYWNQQSVSYGELGEWQLVSKPLVSGPKESMPSLHSFETSYVRDTVLRWGRGYWAKPAASMDYYGATITDTLLDVSRGWNIIGSISVPVSVDSITSEPSGILSSSFFKYQSLEGYSVADSILPGSGYWVKVTSDGKLRLRGKNP